MKMDRLISIIMLLLECKTVSASELAKKFGVSVRTIYRDVDTIALAGIPIVAFPGQNGGIGIMEQYKVDKRLFTVSDITSLLIGLGGIHSAMSGEQVARTLAKVKGMIPPEHLSDVEFQANQVAIDLTPWGKDTFIDEKMGLIRQALLCRKTLSFEYTNAAGTSTSREVEPYRLLYKGSGWYLQGYCLLRNEFRIFRFYRMVKLSVTGNDFVPRDFNPSLMEAQSDSDVNMVEVCIRFEAGMVNDITEFYGEDAIVSFDGGFYTAKIMIFDNEYSYNMLLMYGDRCEVLEPAHIRKYICKKAAVIADLHRA